MGCRHWHAGFVLALAISFSGLSTQAMAERRFALVVGNDRYEKLNPLQKAVNDARALGDRLAGLGFEVIRLENATKRALNQKLAEFVGKVSSGDMAFFFFAGHGIEIGGTNYLLPTDTPEARDGDENVITGEGIAADAIIAQLQERKAGITMLVLDACRDNPFRRTEPRSAEGSRGLGPTGAPVAAVVKPAPRAGSRSVGVSRGLGQMNTPQGVFVLYSAGVGQTALDRLSDQDADPNSVFTRSFLSIIGRKGLSVQEMAKTTQSEVRRLASTVAHHQMPAYYDQILGSYFFTPADEPSAPVTPPPVSARDIEMRYWESIRVSRNAADFDGYLFKYPNGQFADVARNRLRELRNPPAALPALPSERTLNVAGDWSGVAKSNNATFRYRWRLEQTGDRVEGTIHLSSLDGSSYAFYAVQGEVAGDVLHFAGTHFIENITSRGSTWCLAAGTLRATRRAGIMRLDGAWGPNAVTGGCPHGSGGAVILERADVASRR